VVLFQAGESWAFRTAPDLVLNLQAAAFTAPRCIPRAAMEVLAIIALRQPVTRSEIEQSRGASLSQTSMDILLETGLIKPWGRKDGPGRPTLWVTTERFLAQFGLATLGDLPGAQMVSMRPDAWAKADIEGDALEEGSGVVATETNGTGGAISDQQDV
jgi:segregation and condensation protein B